MPEQSAQRAPRSRKKWRNDAVKLLAFLTVLALEAAFNVGILLGRYRWKNDVPWIGPIFYVMCATLCVLLWALYHQARRVTTEYILDAEDA